MKSLLLILSLLLIRIAPVTAQIMGPAILFDYDAAGNRIKRYYNPSTPINVYRMANDSTSKYPVDTAIVAINDILVIAYPNPVLTVLTIENRNWVEGTSAEIRVSDMGGKLIRSKTTENAKEVIPFGDVSSGMYTVQYFLKSRMVANWKVFKTNEN